MLESRYLQTSGFQFLHFLFACLRSNRKNTYLFWEARVNETENSALRKAEMLFRNSILKFLIGWLGLSSIDKARHFLSNVKSSTVGACTLLLP